MIVETLVTITLEPVFGVQDQVSQTSNAEDLVQLIGCFRYHDNFCDDICKMSV